MDLELVDIISLVELMWFFLYNALACSNTPKDITNWETPQGKIKVDIVPAMIGQGRYSPRRVRSPTKGY